LNKPLEIEVTYTANIARVKLRGRLDTPGVDRIEAKFTSAVVPEGRNTVVDLSEVSFIASMGLRMFIGLAKALKRNNAKLVLFAPQSQVNEIFTTVVLREIMPIVVDEAEAMRFAAT
jgi:anti-anti-sigma factor